MVDDKFTSLKSQLMSASMFFFFEFLKVPMRIKHDKKKKKQNHPQLLKNVEGA